jgi:branched-chain amino acid transport system permease protein
VNLFPEPVPASSPRAWITVGLLAVLVLLPAVALAMNQPFYLTLVSRIMIYAIACVGLNLLIGYTGLVSFGHALYLGLGAYAVGLPVFHGVTSGWAHLAIAVGAALVVSFITGLICLRTSGMAFIMITLAFAQMFFFLGVSLKQYGGDDGIRLDARSVLSPLNLDSNVTLYYLILGVLLASLYLSWRLVHARFGHVLRGVKANERRMTALGYMPLRYKLAAYVASACLTAVAGFLLANLTRYTSPAYSAWNVSGDLIVMVVLGGMGTVIGPLVGAAALLLFEEFLSSITQHWMLPLGVAIILIVLTAKRGLYGSLHHWSVARERAMQPAGSMTDDRAAQAAAEAARRGG